MSKTRSAKITPNTIVAFVSLYGTHEHGAGWIAKIEAGPSRGTLLGDGELYDGLGFTDAIMAACQAIRNATGLQEGKAWVYSPDGQRRAVVDLYTPGCYGDLTWEPAEVYAISFEELIASETIRDEVAAEPYPVA
jgi:hypothetical protein